MLIPNVLPAIMPTTNVAMNPPVKSFLLFSTIFLTLSNEVRYLIVLIQLAQLYRCQKWCFFRLWHLYSCLASIAFQLRFLNRFHFQILKKNLQIQSSQLSFELNRQQVCRSKFSLQQMISFVSLQLLSQVLTGTTLLTLLPAVTLFFDMVCALLVNAITFAGALGQVMHHQRCLAGAVTNSESR